MFDLNDLIQLHLLRLFLKNLFRYQLESLLFLSLNLHLDSWLRHLQARLFARHLLEICSDSSLKSLLFSQSLRFSLQSLSHLLDHLLEMLEIYIENSSKSSLFLSLVLRLDFQLRLQAHSFARHLLKICSDSMFKLLLFFQSLWFSLQFSWLSHLLDRLLEMLEIYIKNSCKSSLFFRHVSRHLMTHFVAHLATHLLEILVECSSEMFLYSCLDHLLELSLMIHSLFSYLVTHLQESSLVTRFEAHLMTHLLSRVYSWRIYTSCFIDSARKNMHRRVKDNVFFLRSHTRFRSLSLFHHHVL